jgi:mRNA-degrading endonuclease RelE of RelBE toxin-antitoxin system
MSYDSAVAKVVLVGDAQWQLERLPIHLNAQAQTIIERLAKWPDVSGAKPLRGNLKGHYRIRIGDHRVQFAVVGDVVRIEKIAKRDKFYE